MGPFGKVAGRHAGIGHRYGDDRAGLCIGAELPRFFRPAPLVRDMLEESVAGLAAEQDSVRQRDWTPAQIDEISAKGRLEFKTAEVAIKYYRGLIAWKMQELHDELARRDRQAVFDSHRARWPKSIRIGEQDVAIFQDPTEFQRALDIARTVFRLNQPTDLQVATLISLANQARLKIRTPWANREKFEKASLELLSAVFTDVTLTQLIEIERISIENRWKLEGCCGTGNCAECTHPNVVFRDRDRWHGPTQTEAAPPSTLPLYRIMDHLKARFPDETWGTNFWDARVEFETSRGP